MTIKHLGAREILDSRGVPTLEVWISDGAGNHASFGVPAGKSTGKREAAEQRDGDAKRYDGQGVLKAIGHVHKLAPHLAGWRVGEQEAWDEWLIHQDGTPNKHRLGANTILGLSGAYAKLSALAAKQPLWHWLAEQAGTTPRFPRIYSNLINGGKHAPGLDIQEFMVVPKTSQPSEAVPLLAGIHSAAVMEAKHHFGPTAALVGDEGGMAPTGITHDQAWQLLHAVAEGNDLAADVAASSFATGNGAYTFEGHAVSAGNLTKRFSGWVKRYHLLSLEDPFAEDDIRAFERLGSKLGTMVVGDDLTVTDAGIIRDAAMRNMIQGVIIKPNQIGTLTETLRAIDAAQQADVKAIISHRSGETVDAFVSDLAVAVGAFGLKIGAPARGERVAKYNRLLEIEEEMR
jgi:enolase